MDDERGEFMTGDEVISDGCSNSIMVIDDLRVLSSFIRLTR